LLKKQLSTFCTYFYAAPSIDGLSEGHHLNLFKVVSVWAGRKEQRKTIKQRSMGFFTGIYFSVFAFVDARLSRFGV
jgi:hypothetical protein